MLGEITSWLDNLNTAYVGGDTRLITTQNALYADYEALLPAFSGAVAPGPEIASASSASASAHHTHRHGCPSTDKVLTKSEKRNYDLFKTELEIAIRKQYGSRHMADVDVNFMIQECVDKVGGVLSPFEPESDKIAILESDLRLFGQQIMAESQSYQADVKYMEKQMEMKLKGPQFTALRNAAGPNASPDAIMKASGDTNLDRPPVERDV